MCRQVVTDADGKVVTDSSGQPVTQASPILVTYADGNIVTMPGGLPATLAPPQFVTDAEGNLVTDASGNPVTLAPAQVVTDANGNPVTDSSGNPVTVSPPEVVTDVSGKVVTDSNGNPVTRQSVVGQQTDASGAVVTDAAGKPLPIGAVTDANGFMVTDKSGNPIPAGGVTDAAGNLVTDASGNPVTLAAGFQAQTDASGNLVTDASGNPVPLGAQTDASGNVVTDGSGKPVTAPPTQPPLPDITEPSVTIFPPYTGPPPPPLDFDINNLSEEQAAELDNIANSFALFGFGDEEGDGDGEPPAPPSALTIQTVVTQKMQEITGGLTPAQVESISSAQRDMVSSCTIDGGVCDYKEDFHLHPSREYGNCYTFNGGDAPKYTSILPGSNNGLKMIVKSNTSDYLFTSATAGVVVSIHPQSEVPFPNVQGYRVSLGSLVDFVLRFTEITRLARPYGECVESPDSDVFLYPRNYTLEGCFRSCYQSKLVAACACRDSRFPAPKSVNVDVCSGSDRVQRACHEKFQLEVGDDIAAVAEEDCGCADKCLRTGYKIVTSKVSWPIPGQVVGGCQAVDLKGNKTCNEVLRENAAMLRVYYDQVNYEIVRESPAVHFMDLFLGIVNSVALWLGLSVCGVTEVFVILVQALLALLTPFALPDTPSARSGQTPPSSPKRRPASVRPAYMYGT